MLNLLCSHRHLPFIAWFLLFFLVISLQANAGELIINPPEPRAFAGGTPILLTVANSEISENNAALSWSTDVGKIESRGNSVAFTPPDSINKAIVTVSDGKNSGTVTIPIIATTKYSAENVEIEIFKATSASISDISFSAEKNILWLLTASGTIEKRDGLTGQLLQNIKKFRNSGQYPNYHSLSADNQGNLITAVNSLKHGEVNDIIIRYSNNENIWNIHLTGASPQPELTTPRFDSLSIQWGISDRGLWSRSKDGELTYDTAVPNGFFYIPTSTNKTQVLAIDDNDGIWVTGNGQFVGEPLRLGYRSPQGVWHTFTDFPLNTGQISAISADIHGGLWMSGLFGAYESSELWYRSHDGGWTPVNTDPLEGRVLSGLVSDQQNGVWSVLPSTEPTKPDSLAHYSLEQGWTLLSRPQSAPRGELLSMANDPQNGIWMTSIIDGFDRFRSVISYRSSTGEWFNDETFSDESSAAFISNLAVDSQGIPWIALHHPLGMSILNYSQAGSQAGKISGNWLGTLETGLRELLLPTIPGMDTRVVINSMAFDRQDGLWLATHSHILYYPKNGNWISFSRDQYPELPAGKILSLAVDPQNGIWVGFQRGLAYRSPEGTWKTINTNHPEFVERSVFRLEPDRRGGVWMMYSSPGEGSYFEDHSNYEYTGIAATAYAYNPGSFHSRTTGGTEHVEGLGHLSKDEQWWSDDELIYAPLIDITVDTQGTLWSIRKHLGGDFARTAVSYATKEFNFVAATENSSASGEYFSEQVEKGNIGYFSADEVALPPSELYNTLHADKQGRIWINAGFFGGLVQLSFNQKYYQCGTTVSTEACVQNLNARHAALLIHPNGSGNSNQQEKAVTFMASHIYRNLYLRGYNHDEIYYLGYDPEIDFNGDLRPDHIIDAPVKLPEFNAGRSKQEITVNDVRAAFDWAEQQGKLDQPLVVVFVDHGDPDQLLLQGESGSEVLTATVMKQLLDDYQNKTNNQVIVILEACHTGTFIDDLRAPGRMIITSADQETADNELKDALAYYSDAGQISFTRFLFDELRNNFTFNTAYLKASNQIHLKNFPNQRPQIDNQLDANNSYCLTAACSGSLPGILKIEMQNIDPQVQKDQPVSLQITANKSPNLIRTINASITLPGTKYNQRGYPTTPVVHVPLIRKDGKWSGQYTPKKAGSYKLRITAAGIHNNVFPEVPETVTFSVDGSNEDPVREVPVDPTPTEPDPVDPISTEPDPIDPTPTEPDPVDPISTEPDPVDPAPTEPDPVDPTPTEPDPVDPTSTEPDPVEPTSTEPDPVNPTPTEPDPINSTPNAPLTITNQYSGSWYDPSHNGEGYAIEILANDQALITWYTYDKSGQQAWIIGTGSVIGNTIAVTASQITEGGVFGSEFNPATVVRKPWGGMVFTFADCHRAKVNYTGPDAFGSGTLNLERLSSITNLSCSQSSTSTSSTTALGKISGTWYDPSHNGEGYVIQVLDNNRASIYWYTYDKNGKQAWVTGTGTVEGRRITMDKAIFTEGGIFGSNFDPDSVQRKDWGRVTFDFSSCASGTVSYESSAGFGSGQLNLSRLTTVDGYSCDTLP